MRYLTTTFILFISSFIAVADDEIPGIDQFTQGMEKHDGFVDFYWDQSKGKLYLEIEKFNEDLLYINYLQSGVGSNDIGLDRGQIGGYSLVQFKRYGHKVMMVEPNQTYRAFSDNAAERQAVADGFAQSVLWGGEIKAINEQSVLVDWTDFLLRDSQDIHGRLTQMNEGQFSLDINRSAIYIKNSKNFPENTELEALITLQGSQPGKHISSVAPANNIISVRTHHSLIKLPDEPYRTRDFDPRSGGIPITFKDYAVPLGKPMKKQWVIRHRLEKKDPGAAISDPIKPIIYYLDPGTPEPVRSALLDGARWWSEAFESIGFSNAFEVKLLPEGADPLDIRYNTIQWVHRSTRGWSYGASIVDPRSGEILKGHVTLGSLRVRQDMLIAQSLLSPYGQNSGTEQIEQDIENMALARLRQLSAHEVGHTLGLIHNFYASSFDRASVMDYPHPLVQINPDGQLDLTEAYDIGIGSWDQVSLSYLYQDISNQNEKTQLNQLLNKARRDGHVFIADRDARTQGGSHPYAHLWDNGKDAAQGLLDVLNVRQTALNNFGINTIKDNQPIADLERHLVPVYLFHRYQTEAAVKLIAGVNYRYAIKGEENIQAKIVEAQTQVKALDAVLKTIDAKVLALPKKLLPLLLPPVEGSFRDREHFNHRTGLNFDAIGVAETAAKHSITLLLNPARINRLIEHHARDNNYPSLNSVLNKLWQHTWLQSNSDQYIQSIQQSINWVTLVQMIETASNNQLSPSAQATFLNFLSKKKKYFSKKGNNNELANAAIRIIDQYLEGPSSIVHDVTENIPPGSPIGSTQL